LELTKAEEKRLTQIVWALKSPHTDKGLAHRDFERFVKNLTPTDRLLLRDTLADMLAETKK